MLHPATLRSKEAMRRLGMSEETIERNLIAREERTAQADLKRQQKETYKEVVEAERRSAWKQEVEAERREDVAMLSASNLLSRPDWEQRYVQRMDEWLNKLQPPLRSKTVTHAALRLPEGCPGWVADRPTEVALGAFNDVCTCGFLMQFQDHGTHRIQKFSLGIERMMQVLECAVPYLTKQQFANGFPKSCPGCVTVGFLCIGDLHPCTIPKIEAIWRQLLGDVHGRIVERGEVQRMCQEVRSNYSRRESPYPFMGNCLDFRSHHVQSGMGPFVERLCVPIGRLLLSTTIRSSMAANEDQCVRSAAAFLSSRTDQKDVDFPLLFGLPKDAAKS